MTPTTQDMSDKMTPEEKRVAVAECCGWGYVGSSCLKHEQWKCWTTPKGYKGKASVPDYLNDLNAMREAEKTLTDDESRERYVDNLMLSCGGTGRTWTLIHASAEERVNAYLITKHIMNLDGLKL